MIGLTISHFAPGHHTVKVSGALYMELHQVCTVNASGTHNMGLYRSAQDEGIERTDLSS